MGLGSNQLDGGCAIHTHWAYPFMNKESGKKLPDTNAEPRSFCVNLSKPSVSLLSLKFGKTISDISFMPFLRHLRLRVRGSGWEEFSGWITVDPRTKFFCAGPWEQGGRGSQAASTKQRGVRGPEGWLSASLRNAPWLAPWWFLRWANCWVLPGFHSLLRATFAPNHSSSPRLPVRLARVSDDVGAKPRCVLS